MNRDKVNSLILCKKKIISPPKKVDYSDPRNKYTLRNDFTCRSEDRKEFEVFMRHNSQLPFIFSIGLRYKSPEGAIILCRYNGKHLHKNKIGDSEKFDDFHIHKLYDVQLYENNSNQLDANPTDKYITYKAALFQFLNDCNIDNWDKYFPDLLTQADQTRIEGV